MAELLAATRYAPAWVGIAVVVGFALFVIAMIATAIRH